MQGYINSHLLGLFTVLHSCTGFHFAGKKSVRPMFYWIYYVGY